MSGVANSSCNSFIPRPEPEQCVCREYLAPPPDQATMSMHLLLYVMKKLKRHTRSLLLPPPPLLLRRRHLLPKQQQPPKPSTKDLPDLHSKHGSWGCCVGGGGGCALESPRRTTYGQHGLTGMGVQGAQAQHNKSTADSVNRTIRIEWR